MQINPLQNKGSQTVNATENKPLIVLSPNAKGKHIITKYWRDVKNPSQSARAEELWSSSTHLEKLDTNKHTSLQLNLKQLPSLTLSWSPPKQEQPQQQPTIVLIQYDQSSCHYHFPTAILDKSLLQRNAQSRTHYYQFATNPNHYFSAEQARAIYFALERNYKSTDPEIQHFLSLWPGIDKFDQTAQLTQYQLNPLPKPAPLDIFPCTVEEAIVAVLGRKHETAHQAIDATSQPPILHPVPQPNKPIPIPNISFRNHNLPKKSKALPPADHKLWLQVTPAGKQNRRKEVFYAKPIFPTPKNPSCEPFPVSPLKSTVAVLFCDINPLSPTYNQPVIHSINVAASTEEEITNFLAFLAEHRANPTQEQLDALLLVGSLKPSQTPSQPQGEPLMVSNPQPCIHCQTMFVPTRSSSVFCSTPCRVTHHSESRRKQHASSTTRQLPTPKPTEPTNAVTKEEFQALSSRVDQLIQLLTPKS